MKNVCAILHISPRSAVGYAPTGISVQSAVTSTEADRKTIVCLEDKSTGNITCYDLSALNRSYDLQANGVTRWNTQNGETGVNTFLDSVANLDNYKIYTATPDQLVADGNNLYPVDFKTARVQAVSFHSLNATKEFEIHTGNHEYGQVADSGAFSWTEPDLFLTEGLSENPVNWKNIIPVVNGTVCFPSIQNGRLYIHEGNALLQYDNSLTKDIGFLDFNTLGKLEFRRLCDSVDGKVTGHTPRLTDNTLNKGKTYPNAANHETNYGTLVVDDTVVSHTTSDVTITFRYKEPVEGIPMLCLGGRLLFPDECNIRHYVDEKGYTKFEIVLDTYLIEKSLASSLDYLGITTLNTDLVVDSVDKFLALIFEDQDRIRDSYAIMLDLLNREDAGDAYRPELELETEARLLTARLQTFLVFVKTEYDSQIIRHRSLKQLDPGSLFFSRNAGGFLINSITGEVNDFVEKELEDEILVHFNHRRPLSLTLRDSIFNLTHPADGIRQFNYAAKDRYNAYSSYYPLRAIRNYQLLEWYLTVIPPSIPASSVDPSESDNPDISHDVPIIPMTVQKGRRIESMEFVDLEDEGVTKHTVLKISRRPNFSLYVDSYTAPNRLSGYYYKDDQDVEMMERTWTHTRDATNPNKVVLKYEGGCWIFYDVTNSEEIMHSSECFKTTNPWDTSLEWKSETIVEDDKPVLLAHLIVTTLYYGDRLPASWYTLDQLTEPLPNDVDNYDYDKTQESWYTAVDRTKKIPDSQIVQDRSIYPSNETTAETKINEPDPLRTSFNHYGIIGTIKTGADGSYYIEGEYSPVIKNGDKIDPIAMGLSETLPSSDLDEIVDVYVNQPRRRQGLQPYEKDANGKWPVSIFPIKHVPYKISVTIDIIVEDNSGHYTRAIEPSEMAELIAEYNTVFYNRDPEHFVPVIADNGVWPSARFPLDDIPWINDSASASLIQILDTDGRFQEVQWGLTEITLTEEGECWAPIGKRHWYTFTTVASEPAPDDIKLSGSPDIPSPMKDVGVYPITKGTLKAPHGYKLVIQPGQVTILPKPISVVAHDQYKLFGAEDPEFTYDMEGTIEVGVDVSGNLARETGEAVGTYSINLGTLEISSSNYEIQYTPGTLTIAQADITVTANSYSVLWGEDIPMLDYTTSPANARRTEITGTLGTNLPSGRLHVGVYQINQGSLNSVNYNIKAFINGSITVTPNHIFVDAVSLSSVYRAPVPLRYTVSIPEAYTDFSGNLALDEPEGSRDARGNLKVGIYHISKGDLQSQYGVWVGELWNKDYDFDYLMEFGSGQYTVTMGNTILTARPTLQLPDEDDITVPLDFETYVQNPVGIEAYKDEFSGGLVISGESSPSGRPDTTGPKTILQKSDKAGYSNVGLTSDCYNISYMPAMFNHIHAGDIPGQSIAVVVKATAEYTENKVFKYHKSFTVNVVTTDTNTAYQEDTSHAVEETQTFGRMWTARWIPDNVADDASKFLDYLKLELANGHSIHDKIYHRGANSFNTGSGDPDGTSLLDKLLDPAFVSTLNTGEKALLEGVCLGGKAGAVGVMGPWHYVWRLKRNSGGLANEILYKHDSNNAYYRIMEENIQEDTPVSFTVEEATDTPPATETFGGQTFICNKAVVMDVSLVSSEVEHHYTTSNVETTYGPSYQVVGVANMYLASAEMLRYYLEDLTGRGVQVYGRVFVAADNTRTIEDTLNDLVSQTYQTKLADDEKLLFNGILFAYQNQNDDVVASLSLQDNKLVKTEIYRGTSNVDLHTILGASSIPTGSIVSLATRVLQEVVATPTGTTTVYYTLNGENYQSATVNTYSIALKTVTTDNPVYTRVFTVSPRYDEESISLIATTVSGNTFGYIDWGDGSPKEAITKYTFQQAKTDGGMLEFTHEYSTPGYYLVTVTGSVRYCSFGKIVDGVADSEELSRVVGLANAYLDTFEGTMAVKTDIVDNNQPSLHTYHVYEKPIGTFADMPNADVLSTFRLGRRISNMTAMFRNSGITNKYKNIVIPASCRNLNYAFYNCSKLVTLDGMFAKILKATVLSNMADRSILCRNAFWFPTENTHIVSSIPLGALLTYQSKFSTYWCDVYGTRYMNGATAGQLLDGLASAMFYNVPYLQEYRYQPNDNRYLPMSLSQVPSLNGANAFAVLAYYTTSGNLSSLSCTYQNRSFSPVSRTVTIALDGTEKTLDITGLKLDMESYPAILSVLRSKTVTYTNGDGSQLVHLEEWLKSNPSGGMLKLLVSNHAEVTKDVTLVGKP